MNDRFPDEIDEMLWDEACRRAEAIREFLKRRSGDVTPGDMALLAAELEVSRATAFRFIKLFRAGGTVMSLVERKPGRPDGRRMLDLAGVAIVQRAGPEMLHMLRGHMMGENKARFGNAIEEIVDCARQSRTSSQLHLI
jgi:hypothetical protein